MRIWRVVVVALFLAAVVGAVLVVKQSDGVAQAGQQLGYAPPASQPVLSVVGDSWTTGTAYGGAADPWPRQLAVAEQWTLHDDSSPSLAFVPSKGEPSVESKVAQVVGDAPNIVVLWVARGDLGQPPAKVGAAARAVLSQLSAKLPSAKVVLVGPAWPDGAPSAGALAVRDAERAAAQQSGAEFVDPLAEGWFAGRFAALISADNAHPSDDGHRHIAYLLQVDLGKLGVGTNDGPPVVDPTPPAVVTSVAVRTQTLVRTQQVTRTATTTATPAPQPTVTITQPPVVVTVTAP